MTAGERDVTSLETVLLTRSADVTVVFDADSNEVVHQWRDPTRSELDLGDGFGTDRLVSWVHPDDLPAVLKAYAPVRHERAVGRTVARMHPDHAGDEEVCLLIAIHDVGDEVPNAMMVQAWVLDRDIVEAPSPHESLSSLAAAAPIGLQVRGSRGHVSFENERFGSLVGDARATVDQCIEGALTASADVTEDLSVDDRSLRLRVVPSRDDEGRLVMAVASLEDITSLRQARAERDEAAQLFQAVFRHSPVATAVTDLDGRVVHANDSLTVLTGYPVDELLALNAADVVHPDDLAAEAPLLEELVRERRPSYQMELRVRHRAGHQLWADVTVAPVRSADGTIGHFIAHLEDVTHLRSIATRLREEGGLTYWATHDHLTALANRRYLELHLEEALVDLRRASDRFGLLFLDLDDFKPINDDHGHGVGDQVLATIAARIRRAGRDQAMVARYGGDEFVVVLRPPWDEAEGQRLVDRLLASVASPVTLPSGDSVVLGASIGVAVSQPGDDVADLLQRADAAAYRAKAAGKGRAAR